jgi:hypothetical protein
MKHLYLTVGLILLLTSSVAAQLYSQNFEVDDSANWTLNGGPSDEAADFFFNYASVGIPLAPNSAPSLTPRGIKLQANQANGIFSGMSASPTGESFSGNYTVSFDWWGNVNGPFPAGGNGSTQLSTFGVGTSGTIAQWPGAPVQDSVWFGATGDGNSSVDWRAYSSAAPVGYANGSPVFAAPVIPLQDNRNNSNPHYAGFGGNTAPADQLLDFPQQSGVTLVGSAGMEWHQVDLEVADGLATWYVDDLRIATVDLSTVVLGGGNIFFGHSDINATSSTDPNDGALLFTLIDNVVVTEGRVPEPATLSLLAMAALAVVRRRHAR